MNATSALDAIELLKSDHREVEDLFQQYKEAKEAGQISDKYDVAQKVCAALLIHMNIEESIFYPAARKATGDDDLLNEAQVEHNGAKELIEQLGALQPEDPMFDAKIKVLSEQIEHHVNEEETKLFPEVRKSTLNAHTVGQQLFKEKSALQQKYRAAHV